MSYESPVKEYLNSFDPSVQHDFLVRICLVGDAAVGKTAITHRYVKQAFTAGATKATIGVDFSTKCCVLKDGTKVRIQFWDTAGQERFRAVSQSFYKNADGVMVVYDISSPATFEHVQSWMKEVQHQAFKQTNVIICGNKQDVRAGGAAGCVSQEDLTKLQKQYPIKMFECSAKNDLNIKESIEYLMVQVVTRMKHQSKEEGKEISNEDALDAVSSPSTVQVNEKSAASTSKGAKNNKSGCNEGLKSGSNDMEI